MNARGKVLVLLGIFALCGSAALITFFLQNARDAAIGPAELYAVVNRQLADVRAANFPRAYEHASTDVQQRFNIEQFTEMARKDFAGIAATSHIEFGFVEKHGRHAVIQVFFIDDSGQVTPCIYSLVNEGEGWKINGTHFLRRWPAGARLGGMRS